MLIGTSLLQLGRSKVRIAHADQGQIPGAHRAALQAPPDCSSSRQQQHFATAQATGLPTSKSSDCGLSARDLMSSSSLAAASRASHAANLGFSTASVRISSASGTAALLTSMMYTSCSREADATVLAPMFSTCGRFTRLSWKCGDASQASARASTWLGDRARA